MKCLAFLSCLAYAVCANRHTLSPCQLRMKTSVVKTFYPGKRSNLTHAYGSEHFDNNISVKFCRTADQTYQVFFCIQIDARKEIYIKTIQISAFIMTQKWKHDLLSCCTDSGLSCKTLFCPCVTYGEIAQQSKNEKVLFPGDFWSSCCLFYVAMMFGFQSFLTCHLRINIKNEASPLKEFFISCCCGYCALCQVARESKDDNTASQNTAEQIPILVNTMMITN